MHFEVERVFLKLVPCIMVLPSLDLWSVMRAVVVIIWVRAEVSLEAVETVWVVRGEGGKHL